MSVKRSVHSSGLRIVTEEVPSVRSAAVGIWVNVGSRDEAPATAGASHFLEHLLFKGTTSRTALDISSSIESVGGEMNAFTSKEYTCFYARVIDTDLPMAIEVVSDLITSSIVTALDVDAERKVVLEEIAMRDDDPSDLVHDLFSDTYYGDTQIGRPILGTVNSIKGMSRNTVFNYYKKKYLPQDLVVAVAGNIKHKRVVAMVEQALSRDNFLDVMAAPVIRPNIPIKNTKQQSVGLMYKKSEQAHMFYGMEGVARADDRRFAMGVLSAALGGGMSSRLFQEIREKRGLAYSVYAYAQQFAGSGVLGFYAGCNPTKAIEVVEIIRSVLSDVADNGMTHEEIERAKGAVRGSLVLSQEDTGSRMSRIGKNEIVYGQVMDFDDILKAISRVSAQDIHEIASEFLVKTPTLALVGPFKNESKFEKVLQK
ncbi:peptidase M16 [Candidatus Planktophila dulcis]|uniref:Peptidase M16 n=2 Tax=root TaxID=1 RepID=A0AAC9YTB6_9ACTN|nr:pitrilysin family protein [Candidatus Planktophila dulcis]ASY12206.1 peptidase M16 [Candidatus Planktophila dulcis]ASY21453.1 peptidase M16 [Candidatus Planktophila dulcis]